MPELPEVETVRNVLKKDLIGLKIVSYDLKYENIFENKEEINKILNNEIVDILRFGKYLVFKFNKGFLVSHLRMEGKYFYIKDYILNKHMHVFFKFDNGYYLIYQDVRKFGRMHFFNTIDEVYSYMNIGMDANSLDLDINDLFLKMKKSKKLIKELLLDQSFIAGLGNIYVDEVLFASKIMPNEKASNLDLNDLNNILINSKIILDKAIINKGTTIRSYTSELGVSGSYQEFLNVHTKEKCPNGHIIFKMKVGGRTSYYCPNCQHFKKRMVIGLTGSIASGKTNISNNLKRLGFIVSDADEICRNAYNEELIINQIKDNFNEVVVNNKIDKKLLSNIIFNNEEKRKILNNILHPYIKGKMEEDINNHNLIFLDVPLLFETNFYRLCDKTICCYLDRDTQINRLMYRDKLSKEEALARINSQMNLEEKAKLADYIIDTSKDFNNTYNNLIETLSLIFKES